MSDSEPTLAQVGEFGVIEAINADRRQPDAVELGPGDDAAVITAADGRTVVSTDMLVQDRHFRLDWSTAHDIGRKAIAQNAKSIPTTTPAASVCLPTHAQRTSTACWGVSLSVVTVHGANSALTLDRGGSAMSGLDATGWPACVGSHAVSSSN